MFESLFTLAASYDGASEIAKIYKFAPAMADASKWLLTLIPVGAGLGITYFALARNTAQDENTAAQHTKSIRSIIIGAVIGMGASGLVGVLGNYVDTSKSKELACPSGYSVVVDQAGTEKETRYCAPR